MAYPIAQLGHLGGLTWVAIFLQLIEYPPGLLGWWWLRTISNRVVEWHLVRSPGQVRSSQEGSGEVNWSSSGHEWVRSRSGRAQVMSRSGQGQVKLRS